MEATQEAPEIEHVGDPGKTAALAAADGKKLSPEQHVDALSWLIGEGEDEEEVATKNLRLNIGTYQQPRWMDWTIRAVDRDVLTQLQRQSRGTRAQRRGTAPAEVDPELATLKIVSQGTLSPDLDAAAAAKGVQRAPDPDHHRMQVLKHRFRNKPGLLDQLSGEIFDLSGYDEEAVQEAKEVVAAGN